MLASCSRKLPMEGPSAFSSRPGGKLSLACRYVVLQKEDNAGFASGRHQIALAGTHGRAPLLSVDNTLGLRGEHGPEDALGTRQYARKLPWESISTFTRAQYVWAFP